jgi:hypothetical protein
MKTNIFTDKPIESSDLKTNPSILTTKQKTDRIWQVTTPTTTFESTNDDLIDNIKIIQYEGKVSEFTVKQKLIKT